MEEHFVKGRLQMELGQAEQTVLANGKSDLKVEFAC